MVSLIRFKNKIKAKASLIFTHLLFLYLSSGTANAQAANPFDTTKVISAGAGQTFDAQMMYYIKLGGKLVISAVMLFGVATAITYLYTSFKEAQREGHYSTFITAIVMLFILIIVAALIANFAWGWIEGVSL